MRKTRDEVAAVNQTRIREEGWLEVAEATAVDGTDDTAEECLRALEIAMRSVEICYGPDQFDPESDFHRSRLMLRLNQLRDALTDKITGAKSPLLSIAPGRGQNSAGASASKRRFKVLAGLLVLDYESVFGSRNAAALEVATCLRKIGKRLSEKPIRSYASWLERGLAPEAHPDLFPKDLIFQVQCIRHDLEKLPVERRHIVLLDAVERSALACERLSDTE